MGDLFLDPSTLLRMTEDKSFAPRKKMRRGKNYKKAGEAFKKGESFSPEKALEVLEKFPKAKFDESVEVHIKTNIDPKKSDQQIRSSVELPNGTGKEVRVAAFTETQEKQAKEAGADLVGGEDLVEKIATKKNLDFDVAVATPEMMPKLAKIAKILGPKGLMPNPKSQTVGPKIEEMITSLKKGRLDFKNDDSANIHVVIGKRSFGKDKLLENYKAFMEVLEQNKPTGIKGRFIKSITLTATMTPGIRVSF